MTHRHHHDGRRSFLTTLGASAMLLPFAGSGRAEQPPSNRRFVGLYFQGGWDVLLGPDPRAPGQYSGIDLGLDRLAAANGNAEEDWHPFPVMMAGQEVLWGPTMHALTPHADVMTLFRGINMNTVAHPTGRAYVNTFIPPVGVTARGDSMGTRMAAAGAYDDLVLPNIALGVPSYNRTFAPELTAMQLASATQMESLLQPLEESSLSTSNLTALREAQDELEGCVHEHYGTTPAEELSAARARMRDLIAGDYADAFDIGSDPDLMSRYAIGNPTAGTDPAVIAATISRLLDTGLTRTVSARLQRALDTHGVEWATQQPGRQRAGFEALAVLLSDLRQTDPQLEHTTVVVYSEFARTPHINGRGGRDHHFAGSMLVFGGGLRRGVCGATTVDTLGLTAIDPVSGMPDEGGRVLMPEDIGATLAKAAGMSHEAFRVDPLDAWIA